MKLLDNQTNTNPLMVLMKGEPKTGKKHAWGSFPEPIYAIDTDYRMDSLRNDPLYNRRDIEYDSFTDFAEVWEKLEDLQEHCPYKTVVMHSLTSLARLTQNYLFVHRGVSEESKNVAVDKKEKRNLKVGVIPLMGIADYSGETSALSGICTKLRVIFNRYKVNVVLVCHIIVTETQSLDGTDRIHRRILTGGNKIASEIPSYFNEVWHFEADSGVTGNQITTYYCRTRPSSLDFAGTSLYGIPDKIDFTNRLLYPEIMSYVKGLDGTVVYDGKVDLS